MKILFIGDVVSKLGRQTVKKLIPDIRQKEEIDLVFANGENLAGGRGVTEDVIYEMLEAGIDYFTSGHHIFDQDGWENILPDDSFRILRPANYPNAVPGKGSAIVETQTGEKVLLVNLLGKIFLNPSIGLHAHSPFDTLDQLLATYSKEKITAIVIDFHAEATSEKQALAYYFDGKVSLVVGTHTHVATADARILPNGTAYVTDLGMVGPINSVLGVKKENIWNLLRYPYPQQFEWVKKGKSLFNSVIVDIKSKNLSSSIYRYDTILEKAI